MKTNSELTAQERKEYEAIKAKVIERRNGLIAQYGVDWRKHEKPMNAEQELLVIQNIKG